MKKSRGKADQHLLLVTEMIPHYGELFSIVYSTIRHEKARRDVSTDLFCILKRFLLCPEHWDVLVQWRSV